MPLIDSIRHASQRRARRRAVRRRATTEQHVHFHQGPQGRPMPCFDAACPSPRLSI
jgi:hypothetical protein